MAAGLGHHLAAVVVAKAIGHHAVEPGHGLHLGHRHLQQLVDAVLALEFLHRPVGPLRKGTEPVGVVVALLELAQAQAAVGMHDEVEAAAIQHQLARIRHGLAQAQVGDALLDDAVDVGIHAQLGGARRAAQRQAQAKQRLRIGAHRHQPAQAIERQ